MEESIFKTVKTHLNILEGYEFFDTQIINYINSAFFQLYQLGVGQTDEPFTITDPTALWTDFVPTGKAEQIKSYVSLYAQIMFDPPSSSYLVEQLNESLREMEFRLQIEFERDLLPEADMTGVYK